MARTPEPDKRKAREINNDNIMDLTTTINTLSQMSGERDPVKVQRILRTAIPKLIEVLNRCQTLETYHAVAAMREPYNTE